MTTPTLICSVILASNLFFSPVWVESHPAAKERVTAVCQEVAEKAIASGVDPVIATALSYSESRFREGVRSKAGAIGPMQVIPRWACPQGRRKGCDLVQAGVDTLKRHILHYGCGMEYREYSEQLLRKKGVAAFNEWAQCALICDEPAWDKVICHYNAGNRCYSMRFSKLVLKRAKEIRRLLLYFQVRIPGYENYE
jgi:coenzyme F420-reducing hydrogenase delta subunit